MRFARVPAVVLTLVFVAATPAAAQQDMANGCPLSHIALNPGPGPDGTPRGYLPGERVAASGAMKPGSGVANVTLRWGSADGPVLGQAAVDASDSWKGISFTVPSTATIGEARLYLEAHDPEGRPVGRSTYVEKMRVLAPGARQPAALKRPAARRPAAPRAHRPERRPAGSEPQPARSRAVAAPQPATDRPQVLRSEPVARPRAAATTAVRPARRARPAPVARTRAPVPLDRRIRHAPAAARLPAPARRPEPAPPLVLIGLLAAVAAGLAAVGVRHHRRRGPREQPPAVWREREVEAELQEMIAEEHAREATDDRAGTPA